MSRVRHGGFFDIAEWIVRINRRMDDLDRVEIPGSFVGARYTTNAGQSINSANWTVVNFEDLGYDTDSAVTTGAAWKFTAPVSGYYHIHTNITFATTTAWAENERSILYLSYDGTRTVDLGRVAGLDGAVATTVMNIHGGTTYYIAATHYVSIEIYQDSGGALALSSSGAENWITIDKIG